MLLKHKPFCVCVCCMSDDKDYCYTFPNKTIHCLSKMEIIIGSELDLVEESRVKNS